MTDSALAVHLSAAFGLQVFERARQIGRARYGLSVMTPDQWSDAFQYALYQSLPEPSEKLYAVAQAEGIDSLMISPQDETGAGNVVRMLYGRYFESAGSYDRYFAQTCAGDRTVVVCVSPHSGLSLLGIAPFPRRRVSA